MEWNLQLNSNCVPNKLGEGRLSHKIISQNWACGEGIIRLDNRELVIRENFTQVSQSVSHCRFEVPAVYPVKPSWNMYHTSYIYGMLFATVNNLSVPIKIAEVRFSQTIISENLGCGETFFYLAKRERVAGETFTVVFSLFHRAGWISCSYHCKNLLEILPPFIYIWGVVCKWKNSLCSQQARWRTAFTQIFLSELSLCRKVKIVLELVSLLIYIWNLFCQWKNLWVSNRIAERRLSHTLISQIWACGESFVHLAQMLHLQEKLILWYLSPFLSAGLRFLQFSM